MRFLLMAATCLTALAGSAADESWKQPLAVKERALEANIQARHNIMGLYPSQVEVDLKTGAADYTTAGYCDIAHAVCWTSNYLAGCSYRYAFLKRNGAPKEEVEAARQRADEVFEAVFRCQLVTGVPGLQARGYALGHGESYEERKGVNTSDEWHQGAGEYKDLRWRGSPSHHNYSDAIHGLCQYYDLAAEGEQRDRCREAIDRLVGYWVDNNLRIKHLDGKRATPILGITDGKTLNMRVLMAIAGAKVAWHATGKEKYKAAHDKLVEQYGVRAIREFHTEKDFDDAEHCFCHLENLLRIEDDPELRTAYRAILDGLWANHQDDAQSLFTYIYYGIAPDAPERDKALSEALYSLQTWPTSMMLEPRMNSLSPHAKPPYPVYAAAWDNEYMWKGNLLQGDGWWSRIVTGVAVPAEDPMVIYAVDQEGAVYQSRDGGATAWNWRPVDAALPSPARAVAAGPEVRKIFVVCKEDLWGSITGGATWQPLHFPKEGGCPLGVVVDPKADNVIFGIGSKATYRLEYPERHFPGSGWSEWKESVPVADEEQVRFQSDPRGVLKSTDGGRTWELKTAGLEIAHAPTVFAPATTDWVFAGTPAGLFISKDQGETWENGHLVLQFIKNTRREIGGAGFIDAYWRARYYGLIDASVAEAAYTGDE